MTWDKSLYPADWPAISQAIRERAGHRCEQCGAAAGEVGYHRDGQWVMVYRSLAQIDMAADEPGGPRLVVCILTVAHLDHTPANCDPANLRCLCRGCHLRYDAAHHARNAARTRRRRRIERGQMELL